MLPRWPTDNVRAPHQTIRMTTITASALRTSMFQPWGTSRRGWIGVDMGAATTKLAQVERVGDRVQLMTHWIIDNYDGYPFTKDSLESGCLPFQSQLQE